ncbi:hypothetical protein EAO74_37085 [Streptomyces sp. gb1(2016)]|uniref:Uncharacterized protein n=1 Tax=Streptomyces sp. gb1(2016) TaxID=1828321 RepID=A0A652KDT7_9ACTN|nr:hypothetical protein EAO74_37085 [Streptomyces sp. gb1(2016)]
MYAGLVRGASGAGWRWICSPGRQGLGGSGPRAGRARGPRAWPCPGSGGIRIGGRRLRRSRVCDSFTLWAVGALTMRFGTSVCRAVTAPEGGDMGCAVPVPPAYGGPVG